MSSAATCTRKPHQTFPALLQVLQLPVLRPKNLKKLLGDGVGRTVPILGSGSVPTTDDTLAQFLQHAGTLFGKDPTKWEKMGKVQTACAAHAMHVCSMHGCSACQHMLLSSTCS